MIVLNTFDAYGPLLEQMTQDLPLFAPDRPEGGIGFLPSDRLLSDQAMPPDPAKVAIVAVIDHAIPFAHRLLTTATGHSRVASIWLQDGRPVDDGRLDVPFGRELRGAEIDQIRHSGGITHPEDAIYRRVGLMHPGRRDGRWMLRARSHGAGVACTAAGHPPQDAAGLAHPLIAVGLPDWALADTSGAAMPLLMQAAVVFIVARARLLATQMGATVPLVINVSLGITAGPRDGQSLIEELQDQLITDPPPGLGPVHFVLASGNTRQRRLNAVVRPGQTIGWNLPPDDRTLSELQVWTPPLAPGGAAVRLGLALPDGSAVETAFRAPVQAGAQIAQVTGPQGRELARLVLQAVARGDRLRQCLTLIAPPTAADRPGPVLAPPGLWRISVLAGTPADCELVIQRDDRLFGFPKGGRQSWLVGPDSPARDPDGHWPGADPVPAVAMIRRNGTLNAFAWGRDQIRCGAVLADRCQLSSYCSLLPDGTGGDLLAPGDRSPVRPGMIVPGLRGQGMQVISGTSIAAARATRWLAAALAAGARPRDRVQVVAHATGSGGPNPPCVHPALPWER